MAIFDFESALRTAFSTELRAIERGIAIKGCRFHFSQAVMRAFDSKANRKWREESPAVASWVKEVLGLPLIPHYYIRSMWDHALSTPPTPYAERLRPFVDYFQQQWLASDEFIQLWNHFDNDLARTTNVPEGLHSGMRASLPEPHPKLDTFFNWLKLVSKWLFKSVSIRKICIFT